jgi:hypothetical protein
MGESITERLQRIDGHIRSPVIAYCLLLAVEPQNNRVYSRSGGTVGGAISTLPCASLPFFFALPWGRCPQTPAPLCRRWALRAHSSTHSPWLAEPFPGCDDAYSALRHRVAGEALPGFLVAVSFASRTAGTGTCWVPPRVGRWLLASRASTCPPHRLPVPS